MDISCAQSTSFVFSHHQKFVHYCRSSSSSPLSSLYMFFCECLPTHSPAFNWSINKSIQPKKLTQVCAQTSLSLTFFHLFDWSFLLSLSHSCVFGANFRVSIQVKQLFVAIAAPSESSVNSIVLWHAFELELDLYFHRIDWLIEIVSCQKSFSSIYSNTKWTHEVNSAMLASNFVKNGTYIFQNQLKWLKIQFLVFVPFSHISSISATTCCIRRKTKKTKFYSMP